MPVVGAAVGGEVDLRGRSAAGSVDGEGVGFWPGPFFAGPGQMLVSAHDRGVH